MGTILIPQKVNRKKHIDYMAGSPDYNYCIQYRSKNNEPKVIKFAGKDNPAVHRLISETIRETCGFEEVIDIWMEPLGGWEKPGMYKWYEVTYFRKIT